MYFNFYVALNTVVIDDPICEDSFLEDILSAQINHSDT